MNSLLETFSYLAHVLRHSKRHICHSRGCKGGRTGSKGYHKTGLIEMKIHQLYHQEDYAQFTCGKSESLTGSYTYCFSRVPHNINRYINLMSRMPFSMIFVGSTWSSIFALLLRRSLRRCAYCKYPICAEVVSKSMA